MTTKALDELIAFEKEAKAFGFVWPDREMIVQQILNECHEVKMTIQEKESDARIQEEIGDLMQAVVSLCLFSNYDVEHVISQTTQKFETRLNALKAASEKQGLTSLNGQPIEVMIDLWREAKER